MKARLGLLCILLGAVLWLGAADLYGRNQSESDQAGQRCAQVVSVLRALESETPASTVPSQQEMAVVQVDDYGYIGYLSIPSLGLELPVMDHWDDVRLKIAPCRLSGSIETDDLILAGHNYKAHFGPIRRLTPGDQVLFTAMDGSTVSYRVCRVETVSSTAVTEGLSGSDLTLFTCTYGGPGRIRVRCVRSE